MYGLSHHERNMKIQAGMDRLPGLKTLTAGYFYLSLLGVIAFSVLLAFWTYAYYFDSMLLADVNEWVGMAMPLVGIVALIICLWTFYIVHALRQFKMWAYWVFIGMSAGAGAVAGVDMVDALRKGEWERAGRDFLFASIKAGIVAYLVQEDVSRTYREVSDGIWPNRYARVETEEEDEVSAEEVVTVQTNSRYVGHRSRKGHIRRKWGEIAFFLGVFVASGVISIITFVYGRFFYMGLNVTNSVLSLYSLYLAWNSIVDVGYMVDVSLHR